MSNEYTAKWGPKEERPCKLVYGEMIPLTDEQMEARERLRNAPTSYHRPGAARPTAGYRLSVEEKRRIATQTGQQFEDYGQYKAWCRANGKRDIERGEPADNYRRDMAEWERDGAQGQRPHDWKGAGPRRKRDIGQYLQMLGDAS